MPSVPAGVLAVRNVVGLWVVFAGRAARTEQFNARVGRVVEAVEDGLRDVGLGRSGWVAQAVVAQAVAVSLGDLLGGEVCL